MTDLFAGNIQSFDSSALMNSIDVGMKAENPKDGFKSDSIGQMDFSVILSHVMDSNLSALSKTASVRNQAISGSLTKVNSPLSSLLSLRASFSLEKPSFFDKNNVDKQLGYKEPVNDADGLCSTKLETKAYERSDRDEIRANKTSSVDYSQKSSSTDEKCCIGLDEEKRLTPENEGLKNASDELSCLGLDDEASSTAIFEVGKDDEAVCLEEKVLVLLPERDNADKVLVELELAELGLEEGKDGLAEDKEALKDFEEDIESVSSEKEASALTAKETDNAFVIAKTACEQVQADGSPANPVSDESLAEFRPDVALALKTGSVRFSESLESSERVEELESEALEKASEEEGLAKTSEKGERPLKEDSLKEVLAKKSDRLEKESKSGELADELKLNNESAPKESLRKEFAKVTGKTENTGLENLTDSFVTDFANGGDQATQVAATTNGTAAETADKIFAAITGKNSDSASESHLHLAADAGVEVKGAHSKHSGSGMNNGFSFQSRTFSQTYDSNGKLQQVENPRAANFSEFLTKAEMVKTKDGAKVMNIELEQDEIGKLELELVSKNGEVTARLSAESDVAKAKLEELAPDIKENLVEKGVNLTQISVDISFRDADENSKEYQYSGKKNKSNRLNGVENSSVKDIIEKHILPNLRREALNIQSVDVSV